jgi:uncharacterized protein YeaO (DUF488 family)
VTFQIKRIYESAVPSDGTRVLVDRLWPRGVKKTAARLDYWMKDIAPSTELRLWFGHEPEKFGDFRHRYEAELADNAGIGELRKLGRGHTVTLLYAAHDPEINHAQVLWAVLRRRARAKQTAAPARRRPRYANP